MKRGLIFYLLLVFLFWPLSVNAASDLTGQIDGHDFVDLGLSSGKYWSTVNFGANLPEESGEYVNFPRTDVVSYRWGSNWRIPTKDEFQELIDECEWTWNSRNGVDGYLIRGKNGNYIFIPAAGMKMNNLGLVANKGVLYYWTMTKADKVPAPSYLYMLVADESTITLKTEWDVGVEDYPVRPISNIIGETKDIEYSLTISSYGKGSVTYNGATIREKTKNYKVKEGANATISFNPDNGYQIKSVKVNNSNVTTSISNNQYTITNIKSNTTMEVEFEAIPIPTYTLSIKATGNGSVTYNGTSAKNSTQTFTMNEGSSATISFTSDSGYRIKSVKVNNTDVTSNVSNNKYTINNINGNTSVDVEFEAVPIITYNLSITAIGNGSASYDGTTIRDKTDVFTINEGTSAIISFSPDNGYRIKSVKVNNTDVTSNLSSNKYTINKISGNTSLEVEFAEEIKDFESNGIYYSVVSGTEKTICVANGNYGLVLEVPEEVTYQNINWKVVDIDNSVLSNNSELAAIIWNPSITFNTKVSNPNLLLYVKDKAYTSSEVKNTVVNGIAENIELIDAASGNDFYCPRTFTAKKISYTHDYKMETGFGESKGWETIVLPFDVQKYTHSTKGEIEPFTTWNIGSNTKPFWLFELTASGYKDVASIKANTPYIISMPNNKQYEQQYQIPGIVTFSASNVEVQKTDDLKSVSYQGRTFVPNYTNKASDNILALNVNSYYVTNSSTEIDGSKFIRGLRAVHPFEAYMTTTDGTRSIDVLDGMTTAIKGVGMVKEGESDLKVYDTKGVLLKTSTSMDDVRKGLKAGVYIVNGKKVIIK